MTGLIEVFQSLHRKKAFGECVSNALRTDLWT
ncbi:flagellar motor component MotA [Variovorax boronicumulans]|nr:flagellar motor component MotA [Variovorax boronicumulans]MDQ0044354.1 flagellar motor component MotA [Variovorax boronicumulans]